MSPVLSTVKLLPSLQNVVASRYFSRYMIVAVLIIIAIIYFNSQKPKS